MFNHVSNLPVSATTPENMGAPTDFVHRNAIFLSLSGGGLRAAAFSHGVFLALDELKTGDGTLLDDVALINSVSGSSLTSAWYGLHGREGLPRFAPEVLLPGYESYMRMSLLNPGNLLRLLGGGVNMREDFRDGLDERVFKGATFRDIYARQGPEIRIQATDLYHRIAFPFAPSAFEAICSDLSKFSVADAVAASMAVPLVFAPTVVRTYPEACRPLAAKFEPMIDPPPDAPLGMLAIAHAVAGYRDTRPHYVKLADGGLTDNFGVATLVNERVGFQSPYAPLTAREAVVVRRLLLVIVDGSQGPNGDWMRSEEGPTGLQAALAATDAAIDSASRGAADSISRLLEEWQQSLIRYRCGLSLDEVRRDGGPTPWNCADVKFSVARITVDGLPPDVRKQIGAIPTRLTLSREELDVTIEAARRSTLNSPRIRSYLSDRVDAAR
jgi:NTE family protein